MKLAHKDLKAMPCKAAKCVDLSDCIQRQIHGYVTPIGGTLSPVLYWTFGHHG